MNDYKFFKILGEEVPSIGMGTWRIGGGFMTPDCSNDKNWIAALRKGIELGMTLIDTAEVYGRGHSEELVGKAIKGFLRDELFIVTKVWPGHARRDDVLKAAEGSVKRLGTYIDLYLLHWPSENVPLCETMKAMEKLIDKGLVRHIGLSNFELEDIEKARACLSKVDIAAVQNRHSLMYRRYENDVIPYCEREGIMFMSYTPLEKGLLARDPFLAEIGKKYDKTAAQVALNWLIKFKPVVAIPKAGQIEHIVENAGAMGWRLEKDDWEVISSKFREYITL